VLKHENLYARRPTIVVRNRTLLGARSFWRIGAERVFEAADEDKEPGDEI